MLYPNFMGCLSACTFEWEAGDLAMLWQMTWEHLRLEGVLAFTDLLVDRRISRKELSQYCRKRTCSVEAAISLIERLLQELVGGGPDCCCFLPDCFHHAAARRSSLS